MEALQLLASSGANADAPDYNGRTALHVAASEGRKLTVYCLLSRCVRALVLHCKFGTHALRGDYKSCQLCRWLRLCIQDLLLYL